MTVRMVSLVMLGMSVFVFFACKKKEFAGAAPTITTTAVTNVTTSSATTGGMITHNGGATVTASGLCWSRTSNLPTIADDTTQGNTSIGIFTTTLTGLEHGATYHVRAYAINKAGIGYGNAISFTTANAAPVARNIFFHGEPVMGERITVRYTYFDEENDPESGTTFQWFLTNDTTNGTFVTIINATDSFHIPAFSAQHKFLKVGVMPKSSAGTSPGAVYSSWWSTAVKPEKPDTVNSIYNGQPVSYYTITSPVTGRKWLDRNLGAPNTPSGYDDWANKGDLFQWGRAADGHQLVIRAATTGGTTAVNGTTTIRSGNDNPGHALFVVTTADPFDWRNPSNDNLWQGNPGTNNPCPVGYRVPTLDEWFAENLGGLQQAFIQLKITSGGVRNFGDGDFALTVNDGLYWTSRFTPGTWVATQFNFALNGPAYGQASPRTNGLSVRCIKN